MGIWDTNRFINPTRRPDLMIIDKKKKKRICRIVNFDVPADHGVKNQRKHTEKYIDLACKLKKLWNIKLTTRPIVIGALGSVLKGEVKGLEKLEIEESTRTIKTAVLFRLDKILRRVLETKNDSSKRTSANYGVKNSQGMIIIIITKFTHSLDYRP